MKSLDQLRRDAKALHRSYEAGEPVALQRLKIHPPRSDGAELKHSDFLHVIAQEQNFASWPAMKEAVETQGMDRAAKLQRLKIALAHGQNTRVNTLLTDTPDLADGHFGLQCALLNRPEVTRMLANDPSLATTEMGNRRPILHLAYSKRVHAVPDRAKDMIAIAELLVANGADVNDSYRYSPETDHRLSALYGAIGYANNMVLGKWLLEHGANPNDGESLYHSTELGHHDGLRMLLKHGADPKGTNALLRAIDFNDHVAVRLLLDHGAKVEEYDDSNVGGEEPYVIPAIHQAARRMAGPEIIRLLLDAGADPQREFKGATGYSAAMVYGNTVLEAEIEARGLTTDLSDTEKRLAAACMNDAMHPDLFINPELIPAAYQDLISELAHSQDNLMHIQNLVSLGVYYDRPNAEGLTPVQLAGWRGDWVVMEYFLSLRPDLSHVNGYGGTLLSTIIHGSENCQLGGDVDYIKCLELALDEGVALPKRAIEFAGQEAIASFLSDWAEAHPGQVVEHG